jgi:hypothetical protein
MGNLNGLEFERFPTEMQTKIYKKLSQITIILKKLNIDLKIRNYTIYGMIRKIVHNMCLTN